MHGTDKIRMMKTRGKRRPVSVTNGIYQTAKGAHHDVGGLVVPVRSLLAEGADRCQYDAGINLFEYRVAQTETVQMPRIKRFYNNIRFADQLFEYLSTTSRLNIKSNTFLARVESKPVETFFRVNNVMKKGADTSGYVATRSLYLYDIRTKIGENFSTNKSFFIR